MRVLVLVREGRGAFVLGVLGWVVTGVVLIKHKYINIHSLDSLMMGGMGSGGMGGGLQPPPGPPPSAFMAPIQPVPVQQQPMAAMRAIYPRPVGQPEPQQPHQGMAAFDPMSAFDSLGDPQQQQQGGQGQGQGWW